MCPQQLLLNCRTRIKDSTRWERWRERKRVFLLALRTSAESRSCQGWRSDNFAPCTHSCIHPPPKQPQILWAEMVSFIRPTSIMSWYTGLTQDTTSASPTLHRGTGWQNLTLLKFSNYWLIQVINRLFNISSTQSQVLMSQIFIRIKDKVVKLNTFS